MRTTIDGAGRLVVPKAMRDELRLAKGALLEVRLREGRIELEPVPTSMRLERRGRRLVATTEEPLPRLSAEDVRTAIDAQRVTRWSH